MKQPNEGWSGSIERACAVEAILPHPSPLPLGEGATSAASRPAVRLCVVEGGRRFSLSQRERAGVRESRPKSERALAQRWAQSLASCCGVLLCAVWLSAQAVAQEKPAAAVSSVKGVKEEAVGKVKPIEPTVTPPPKNTAQGVNKIDGIDTINGVKADGRAPVLPPPPKAPPVVGVKGTAVNVGGGTVGAGGSIRAVNGVAGINAAKLQNLEVALQIKQNPTPEGPGKAKAAAALLGPGPGTKTGPKKDGRDVFQEFEKLPNKGS